MKCYACGAEIRPSVKYCTQCGKPQQCTDTIIQSAKGVDQDAITALYTRTYNIVYQTIKALIFNEDSTLDLVQECYLKAFQSLDQLDKPENFVAWLKQIATNKAKDWLKKKKPILFSDLEKDDGSLVLTIPDDKIENLPDCVIDQQETVRLVDEILNTLSDEQRLAIIMFYFEERNIKEISDFWGCSENTIKSRLNYGRKKVEAKVLELEKQGTKLYSLAPMPFLVWLLKGTQSNHVSIPSKTILKSIQAEYSHLGLSSPAPNTTKFLVQGVVNHTAAAATKSTISSITKAVVAFAGKSIATKITASVLAVTLVGGGIAATIIIQQQEKEPTPSLTLTEPTLSTVHPNTEPIEIFTTDVPFSTSSPTETTLPPTTIAEIGTIDQYVSTRRQEHIKYETNSSFGNLSFSNTYDIQCQLPEIMIDSEDARICNQNITSRFDPLLDSALNAQNTKTDCSLSELSYDAWLYDRTLTLVVSSASEWGNHSYGIYVIDIDTGKCLTNSMIATLFKLDNYESSIESALTREFVTLHGEDTGDLFDTDFYQQQLALTLSDENMKQVILYPGKDGNLMMACTIYSLAGASHYDYLIPVPISVS